MIKKRVNANAPTLARLAPACVLLYNVISHSHSKRKCSTLMLSSALPENGGCKPLLCGLLCSDNCHFPSFSVIFWLRRLTLVQAAASWVSLKWVKSNERRGHGRLGQTLLRSIPVNSLCGSKMGVKDWNVGPTKRPVAEEEEERRQIFQEIPINIDYGR